MFVDVPVVSAIVGWAVVVLSVNFLVIVFFADACWMFWGFPSVTGSWNCSLVLMVFSNSPSSFTCNGLWVLKFSRFVFISLSCFSIWKFDSSGIISADATVPAISTATNDVNINCTVITTWNTRMVEFQFCQYTRPAEMIKFVYFVAGLLLAVAICVLVAYAKWCIHGCRTFSSSLYIGEVFHSRFLTANHHFQYPLFSVVSI